MAEQSRVNVKPPRRSYKLPIPRHKGSRSGSPSALNLNWVGSLLVSKAFCLAAFRAPTAVGHTARDGPVQGGAIRAGLATRNKEARTSGPTVYRNLQHREHLGRRVLLSPVRVLCLTLSYIWFQRRRLRWNGLGIEVDGENCDFGLFSWGNGKLPCSVMQRLARKLRGFSVLCSTN
jgi:hypothetical protein